VVDDEIDLRQYIRLLIRRWYWIVGVGIAAAGLAFAVSSFIPPVYEASALVGITGPRYRMQFDSRMQDVPFDPKQFAKGYTYLATSSDVLMPLLETLRHDQSTAAARLTARQLTERVEAETVGDGNLVLLTARSDQPEEAAKLADAWAAGYRDHLNLVYGKTQDLTQLESQVVQAKLNVEKSDQALADLRREYGMGYRPTEAPDVVEAAVGLVYQLQAKTRRLTDYEGRAERIAQLLEEARIVAAGADGSSPALVSGLLADMLGLGLLDAGSASLVQIDLGNIDARASAVALVAALEAKQSTTNQTIAGLTEQVASLQSEVAQQQMALEQLLREQLIDQNTYLTLSNKLQESQIETDGDIARIASRAQVPDAPSSPRRLFNAVLAGVVGVVLSILVVFLVEYWRQEGTSG
jgi:uncharacterized protein involved in exopolysaccharide biosynthesis